MPWVILEAMSASLPVISTNQGAISEVVIDQQTGFIITPTPKTIAQKICYLFENPHLARQMGMLGRKRVEQLFSEEVYVRNIINTFKNVLPGSERKI